VGITLNPGAEQVSALEDDVVFPPVLAFLEGELAEAAKAASAKLHAELLESSGAGGARTVRVTVTAPDGSTLPAGLLAVLIFKAPETVEGESVDFRLSHRAKVTVGGQTVDAPPQEGGGVVSVMKKPLEVIACFFYMH
jgi:hypothetical protein